ncbi:hypothetical protein GCM10028809_59380 [Spirosoma gilvum]
MISVTPTSSGTYVYEVTAGQGACTAAESITITVNQVTLTLSPPTPSCGFGSGQLTGTVTPGGNYTIAYSGPSSGSITNNKSSFTIPNLTPGIYSVTALSANGCSAVQSQTITVSPSLTITSPPTVCQGSPVSLTVSGGSGPYTWSGQNIQPSSTSTVVVNTPQAGSFTYTVSASGACPATTTLTVGSPLSLSLTPTPVSFCNVSDGQILLNGLANTQSYTISYGISGGPVSTSSLQSSNGGTITLTGLAGGTYSVTAVSAVSCPASGSTTVNAPNNPLPATLTAGPSATICPGTSVTLTAVVTGGVGTNTFTWSGPGGPISSTASSITVSPTATSTYTVTVKNSQCAGSSSTSQTITVSPSLTITSPPTVCQGSPVSLTVSGGSGPYTWSGQNIQPSSTSTVVVNTPQAGSFTYTVSASGACPATTTLTVGSPLSLSLTPTPVSFCNVSDGQILLNGLANTQSYTISYGISGGPVSTSSLQSSNGGTITLTGLAGGTYSVTAVSAVSCPASGSTTVNAPNNPLPATLTAGPSATICPGTSVTLTAVVTGGVGTNTFTWSGPGGPISSTASSITVSPTATSTYTVTVKNSQCAGSSSTSLTITVQTNCGVGRLALKVYLQGAIIKNLGATNGSGEPLMRDDLRVKQLIPLNDPYESPYYGSIFDHINNPEFQTIPSSFTSAFTGEEAVVDWVFVELRDESKIVQYTRSGLVRRNGTVIDSDGQPGLNFSNVPPGNYYVAVRHRNHLGVMTNTMRNLGNGQVLVDFRTLTPSDIFDLDHPLYKDNERYRIPNSPYYALWGGNANADKNVIYVGNQSDAQRVAAMVSNPLGYQINPILTSNPNLDNASNYVLKGYFDGDVDMSGTTIYVGTNSDSIDILNMLIAHPKNENFPNFVNPQQLPTP